MLSVCPDQRSFLFPISFVSMCALCSEPWAKGGMSSIPNPWYITHSHCSTCCTCECLCVCVCKTCNHGCIWTLRYFEWQLNKESEWVWNSQIWIGWLMKHYFKMNDSDIEKQIDVKLWYDCFVEIIEYFGLNCVHRKRYIEVLTMEPQNGTLSGNRVLTKNPETPIQKNQCTLVITAAQFTIAKCWKQPKCP